MFLRVLVFSFKVNIFFFNNNSNSLILVQRGNLNSSLFLKNFFFDKNFFILVFSSNKFIYLDLDYFFFSWCFFFVRKIKFRHKITWFKNYRKYGQFIRFNLGLSHFTYTFFETLRFKRKKRYLAYHKFLLWSNNYFNLNNCTLMLKNLQPINEYTYRGFRFSRDKFVKRPGKQSKYAHLKSKIF